MTFWIGVLVVAIGLLISIAIHEIGHMAPAKRFGVRVPQYFVGFGPTLWSTTRGETEYGVKAIPLGGFVRMIGMFPPAPTPVSEDAAAEARLRRRGLRGWAQAVTEDAREVSLEEVGPADDGRTFYQLSTPKKLAVMFGGPVTNLIISAVLIAIAMCGIGSMVASSTIGSVTGCLAAAPDQECADDAADSPAALAGFQADDTILSWDGVAVEDWDDISTAIRTGGTDPVPVVVERDGAELTLTVTPALVERQVLDPETGNPVAGEVPYVGLSPAAELQRQPIAAVPGVVWEQFSATVGVVVQLPARLYAIATALFTDAERDPSVIGIIGIGRLAGDATEMSAPDGIAVQALWLLQILASLNMALFVFNMIPLPPLDGGHIAGALYVGARRQLARWRGAPRPGYADTAKLMPVTYVVVILFAGMAVLLAIADIVKPVVLS